jgi:Mn-dependent DtxR family transcriptional regulator
VRKKMGDLTQSNEDYLEAILVISLDNNVVRIKDLAKYLKVKTPSAVSAVKSLSKKNLVIHEHYGYLELTKKGEAAAKAVYKRHKILFKFLHDFLGIDPEIAEKDACSIEHHVAPETMDRLIKLIEFVESCPEKHPTWLSNFYHFARTGKRLKPCKEAKESRKKMFKANKKI